MPIDVYFTYSFYVPTGSTSTFTSPGLPVVDPPDLDQPDAPTVQTENAQIALQTGALETSVTLPVYNPNIDPLVLTYNSATADYRPIFVAHYQYESGTILTAKLTVDGTAFPAVYYAINNPPDINGQASPDSYIEVALEAWAEIMPTALSTGRHTYSIGFAMDTNPIEPAGSGFFTVINEVNNPVGAGWTIGGLESLGTYAGSGGSGAGVYINMGSGDNLWYSGTPGHGVTFTSSPGDYSTLVENSDGSFTHSYPDGTSYNFNSGGQEISQVDSNGLRTTYSYSSGGLLQTITDPYTKVTSFTYNSGGLLQNITDPTGRITTLTHSSAELTSLTLPDSSTWNYDYNLDGVIDKVTDPRSESLTVIYDSNDDGRVCLDRPIRRNDRVDHLFPGTIPDPLRPLFVHGRHPVCCSWPNRERPTPTHSAARSTYYPDWQGYGRLDQTLDPYGDLTTDERDDLGSGLRQY